MASIWYTPHMEQKIDVALVQCYLATKKLKEFPDRRQLSNQIYLH